jgi:hypothetical protein
VTIKNAQSNGRTDNLAMRTIEAILWIALVVAPAFLGALSTFFVVRAFSVGFLPGFRSFAAVLLPLMFLTFVVAQKFSHDKKDATVEHEEATLNQRQKPSSAKREGKFSKWVADLRPWQATALMAATGAVMMQLLQLSTSIPRLHRRPGRPSRLVDSERTAPAVFTSEITQYRSPESRERRAIQNRR